MSFYHEYWTTSNFACLSHEYTLFHCLNKLEETKDFYTMIFMKHSWFTHTIRCVGANTCTWKPLYGDLIPSYLTWHLDNTQLCFGLFWTTGYDEHSLILWLHYFTDNVIFPVLKNIKSGAAIWADLFGRSVLCGDFFGKCEIFLYSIRSTDYDYKNTCILKNVIFLLYFYLAT